MNETFSRAAKGISALGLSSLVAIFSPQANWSFVDQADAAAKKFRCFVGVDPLTSKGVNFRGKPKTYQGFHVAHVDAYGRKMRITDQIDGITSRFSGRVINTPAEGRRWCNEMASALNGVLENDRKAKATFYPNYS